MPTYEALVKTDTGLALAKQIFARAKPGYHPITTGSVQKVIDEAQPVAAPTPAATLVESPATDDGTDAATKIDGDATRPAPTPPPSK